jgi:flagellar hook-associated protein 1 FlgK
VRVTTIQRARDSLLDASYRRERANASGFTLQQRLLAQVEDVFGTLSGHGIGTALDAFWNGWSDLANHPTNPASPGLVRDQGAQLAGMLNDAAARLQDLRGSIHERLDRDVAEFNRLSEQLANLNRDITVAEAGGRRAPQMRDERDRVLDAMAQFAPIRVLERADGQVGVALDGTMIVDGTSARALEVRDGPPVGLGLAGRPGTIPQVGGSLGAMLGILNDAIPSVQAQLDGLADALVREVNALHARGPSGVPFFEPGAVSASTIRLSDAVLADPGAINAGINDALSGPADNRLALAMADLRGAQVSITVASGSSAGTITSSFGGFYNQITTGVGNMTRAAGQSATVYETLAHQADMRRSSVSGVNVDEELVRLMQQQQAYAAAARLVTVADEMARAILQMV